MDHVRNLDLLAAHLDVSRASLTLWACRGCPCSAKFKTGKGYEIQPVLDWIEKNTVHRQKTIVSESTESLRDELLRANIAERKARTELAEIQAGIQKGLFLPLASIQDQWSQVLTNLSARLLNLPSLLAPRLVGLDSASIKKELLSELRSAMDNLTTENGQE